MHKSRLCGFIIDCQDANLDEAARFWSAALGWPAKSPDGPYVTLDTGRQSLNLNVAVQQVDHPSRVHLDIETDDVLAEVKRLEKLGAKTVDRVKTWVVMEAPTGHRFCVVRAQQPHFAEHASRWE
jgi:predicted enzyme related to lactoylglutathione lyase